MDKPKDGGFAFPHPGSRTEGGDDYNVYPELGMTLRDYFAAQSDISDYTLHDTAQLCAFVGETEPERDDADYVFKMIAVSTRAAAKLRYMLADAMIAARQSTSMEGGRGMSDLGDYDDYYDDGIEDDDDEDFDFDCGMMPDGQCSMAGSEWCDWECPHSRAADRIAAMKQKAKADEERKALGQILSDALDKAKDQKS